MNKKQFEALVNKGKITHVGIAKDIEKLSDKEFCGRYVTSHEVAAEVLKEAETPETPTKVPVTINVSSEGTLEVGEIITTKVSLNPGDYAGTMVRVRGTVTPADATKLKYKEGEVWKDLPVEGSENGIFYFGPTAGFPINADAVSEFHSECLTAGKVTTTLEIIEVATGEVIGSGSQTVTIKKATAKKPAEEPAPEPVADAPVVDPVEE